MRKLHWILGCAAIAAAACTVEPTDSEPFSAGSDIPEGYHLENVRAVYPDMTRTSFDAETGAFAWTEGDRLAFHISDGTYLVHEIDPETAWSATNSPFIPPKRLCPIMPRQET